jgi:hypothetical protein
MESKTEAIRKGFSNPHPMLKAVYFWLDGYIKGKFNKTALMTESKRTVEDRYQIYKDAINPKTGKNYTRDEITSDIHDTNPLRAFDIRSWMFSVDECEEIRDRVNEEFTYDPTRPDKKVCVYHGVGKNAIHFHLQVHPNTVTKT